MRKTVMAVALAAVMATSLPTMSAPAFAQAAQPAHYSVTETLVGKLIDDPAAAAVLNKDLPGLLSDAQYPLFKSMSLKAIQQASNGDLSKRDVEKTVADLQALARR